jgi:hypothetical protein
MSDTEFVKDVRIEDRNVREHNVACYELEKHIAPNVAGSLLLIGSKGLAASLFEGRNEKLRVDLVKIDLERFVRSSRRTGKNVVADLFRHLLFAKRHYYKYAPANTGSFFRHRYSVRKFPLVEQTKLSAA